MTGVWAAYGDPTSWVGLWWRLRALLRPVPYRPLTCDECGDPTWDHSSMFGRGTLCEDCQATQTLRIAEGGRLEWDMVFGRVVA